MTDIYENAPIYVCAGCEREMEDPKNAYLKKYGPFEACPYCMTLDELWQLRFGTKE
jgi:DNA-directed RNA polymerase subunit RPC12/RpoP